MSHGYLLRLVTPNTPSEDFEAGNRLVDKKAPRGTINTSNKQLCLSISNKRDGTEHLLK